jgi:hypothetical protein
MAKHRVVSDTGKFQEKTYSEWFCDFWNWLVAVNPNRNDELRQPGPLIFTRGGSQFYGQGAALINIGDRRLTIKPGDAIFVPLMVTVADEVNTPNCETARQRLEFVTQATNESQPVKDMKHTIDGATFDVHRVTTPEFKLSLPQVPYGASVKDMLDFMENPGTFDAAADGYVSIIEFPEEGNHKLYFKAGGRKGYMAESLYEIKVTRGPLAFPDKVSPTVGLLKSKKGELNVSKNDFAAWEKIIDKKLWSYGWN